MTTVVSALVGGVTRMLMMSAEHSSGIVGIRLFPQVCALARDIVDLLLVLLLLEQQELRVDPHPRPRTNFAEPAPVDQPAAHTTHDTEMDDEAKVNNHDDNCCDDRTTPSQMNDFDKHVKSLLQSVGEHLLCWYSEHAAAGSVGVRKFDSQNQEQGSACRASRGGEGSGSGSRGGSGGGSDWDDWDDDGDDTEGPRISNNAVVKVGSEPRQTKADEVRLSVALHGTVALMRSAMSYYLVAAAGASEPAAAAPAATLTGRCSTRSSVRKQGETSKSSPEKEDRPREEGATSAIVEILAAGRESTIHSTHTGTAITERERTRDRRQKMHATAAVDHGSSRSGLNNLPPAFAVVLEGLPSECRQALLRAWKFCTVGAPV